MNLESFTTIAYGYIQFLGHLSSITCHGVNWISTTEIKTELKKLLNVHQTLSLCRG